MNEYEKSEDIKMNDDIRLWMSMNNYEWEGGYEDERWYESMNDYEQVWMMMMNKWLGLDNNEKWIVAQRSTSIV